MLKQEILEASRKDAEQAKKKLKNIEETPTGITGGGSAAGHTVTRTAIRKNNDNISKSVYIQHGLNQLAGRAHDAIHDIVLIPEVVYGNQKDYDK